MPIEIEKKYRLTPQQRTAVLKRLPEVGAEFGRTEFEENVLYGGNQIDLGQAVLRLRRVDGRSTLTYKKRLVNQSPVKQQEEYESEVSDAEAIDAILRSLGFAPKLIYEKRRMTWHFKDAEIVIDELPFGLFMEIEAEEATIEQIERQLGIEELVTEESTYPQLTWEHGKKSGDIIEARFQDATLILPNL